ncbi:MAG: beta-lactamase family protein [Planctomycetes bacterium]|nr:beta-lactamase family protein [Planctomycetota bacterium]
MDLLPPPARPPVGHRASRRSFLQAVAAGVWAAARGPTRGVAAEEAPVPATGTVVPELAPFDRLMQTFLNEHQVPGASLAISQHGKLLLARGYGTADREEHRPVQPGSVFRIASVSKPITAVAIWQMIEQRTLGLDDRIFERLELAGVAADAPVADDRWHKITVRHCLQHTAGWDRDQSFDPIAETRRIARTLQIETPVAPGDLVRFMLQQRLDFDPGEKCCYSNFGYVLLGQLLERITGQSYAECVHQRILAPLGMRTVRLGRALREHRFPDEVCYYDSKQRTGPSLYTPRRGESVPLPYGAQNFESFAAHGGWTAAAFDLLRFADAFNEPEHCPLLTPDSVQSMWSRPTGLAGHDANGQPLPAYFGCGWQVRPVRDTGRSNTWHAGYLAGTEALLVRRWDGKNWAVLFNTNDNPQGRSLVGLIDGALHKAAAAVETWPMMDQYPDFAG